MVVIALDRIHSNKHRHVPSEVQWVVVSTDIGYFDLSKLYYVSFFTILNYLLLSFELLHTKPKIKVRMKDECHCIYISHLQDNIISRINYNRLNI